MLIPGWGESGQIKLRRAKVVVAGVGGLGCPASLYLAAAGVGSILLIDNERFELNNLNRQILSSTKDVGRLKSEAAREKLEALNPEIEVVSKPVEITENNIRELIRGSNVVVDAMDNWKTRFILNEGCVRERIPLVHAGISSWNGQMTTIFPGKGPCLRCLISGSPPEIKPFPVLGATPGVFAMLQVMEVIKLLTGLGNPLIGKLLIFDGESMDFNLVEISRNLCCPICKNV
jgi:adenylyltransferase/sulfurtransferase